MKLLSWTPALLAVMFLGCSAPTIPELAQERLNEKPERVRIGSSPSAAPEPRPKSPHGQSPQQQRLNNLFQLAMDGDAAALAELAADAEHGDPQAQHFAGLVHIETAPARKNPQAIQWLSSAAAQGNLFSVAALAGCYTSGRGVEKDMERGVGLLRAAADMGESFSQYNLGDLYRAPGGRPKDLAQTYAWHAIMIASLPESPSVTNHATQARMIEVTQSRLDRLAKEMTPEQIAEGERIAAQWRRKSWDEVRDDVQRFL